MAQKQVVKKWRRTTHFKENIFEEDLGESRKIALRGQYVECTVAGTLTKRRTVKSFVFNSTVRIDEEEPSSKICTLTYYSEWVYEFSLNTHSFKYKRICIRISGGGTWFFFFILLWIITINSVIMNFVSF